MTVASMACDGCGSTGLALTKISLGRDFFGDSYDRLTPMTDKAPAWYCPPCSKQKAMQVDYRVIAAAWVAFCAGEPSPLADADIHQRSRARLDEIHRYLTSGEAVSGRLLDVGRVADLRRFLAG